MIPVSLKQEPVNFNDTVRVPGQSFLSLNPHPKRDEWRPYWTKVLPNLRLEYKGICSYSATWIPHSTGSHSVDHFLPKDLYPFLAYEWNNFRYCSSRFNSRKRIKNILDPFTIQPGWFEINFNNMLIRPASHLSQSLKDEINNSIDILKLNSDDILVEERLIYLQDFETGEISFDYLQRKTPFIAYELVRQNIVIL